MDIIIVMKCRKYPLSYMLSTPAKKKKDKRNVTYSNTPFIISFMTLILLTFLNYYLVLQDI